MSDQTPETSEEQGHEPSMEDILSSIRQMIDADDIGVNVPIQEESGASDSLEPTSLVKAVEDDDREPEDKPVDPFDILESLAENDSPDDLEIPEISADNSAKAADMETAEVDEVIDLEITPAQQEDTNLALADDEVLILDEALEAETEQSQASPLDYVGIDDLSSDMDLVIDDGDETLIELAGDDEVAAASIQNKRSSPVTTAPVTTANVTGDADMDLVKSLMADLTDDDIMDAGDEESGSEDESHLDLVETETELPSSSAFLAIARQASAEAEAVERGRTSEPLNITPEPAEEALPDRKEPAAQLDDTAIAEADDDLEIWVVEVEDEDDTQNVGQDVDVGTGVITEHLSQDLSEIEQQEIPGMAKAAEKETIIDDDIEADTSSAFANLAQVVQQQEDGAYLGPHIGELVTEAMKPMIKEWLDKNLKGIVERAVTKEVKRISGGK